MSEHFEASMIIVDDVLWLIEGGFAAKVRWDSEMNPPRCVYSIYRSIGSESQVTDEELRSVQGEDAIDVRNLLTRLKHCLHDWMTLGCTDPTAVVNALFGMK